MNDKIIVTHRGTIESIKRKQNQMMLKANYPIPDNKFMRIIEDSEKVVWVSKGQPNFYNKLWSGMVGRSGKASVTFKIDKKRVRKPNGIIKRIFGGIIFRRSQLVMEGDVLYQVMQFLNLKKNK